jgi:hypothetical protein
MLIDFILRNINPFEVFVFETTQRPAARISKVVLPLKCPGNHPLKRASQLNCSQLLMPAPLLPSTAASARPAPLALWRGWWRKQSPSRQDRFITLGPLLAVILFLAAVIAAFGYLRIEEIDREQQAVKRDVEYAQQRLRLRLLERQEQLMRIGRDISRKDVDAEEFISQAESLVNQYPELLAVTWVDAKRRVKVAYASASANAAQLRGAGEALKAGETDGTYGLARDLRQPVYSRPLNPTTAATTTRRHCKY